MAGKWAKIIAWVVIVLVLVGSIGAIVYFMGGTQSGYKSFYLTVNGDKVMTSAKGYEATIANPLQVEVKYSLESEDTGDYTVKIVPNQLSGKDFDFTLDDDVYSFQAEKDLTEGFLIEKNGNSFTVTPKGTVNDVMAAIYPSYTVGDISMNAYENMFLLVVSTEDGESSVSVAFSIPEDIAGVILDPPKIEF